MNKFEETKGKLKECFFGIDEQIDQVVNAFETWMTIKDYQTRPLTVCLWGLTGTGKTALINKTIELLDLNKKKFYVKFGSKTSELGEYFKSNNCKDSVFILDEFQYFRTKDDGHELERDENNSTNIVWELLDGGIVNLYGNNQNFYYERLMVNNILHYLKKFNEVKATIENGVIYHKDMISILKELSLKPQRKYQVDEFKKEFNDYHPKSLSKITPELQTLILEQKAKLNKKNKENYRVCNENTNNDTKYDEISKTEITVNYIKSDEYGRMYDFIDSCETDYNFNNTNEYESFVRNAGNLIEIINFYESLKDAKAKPNLRDYSKSIIFVIGNLDECFNMTNDLNSDLDADYFYNKTKKITILDIRKALLNRFRAEQIARLGSTHIIYPSLNKDAFTKIIKKELLNCSEILTKSFSDQISSVIYSDEIEDLIYKEGVLPVIGARQIFSTITEIITDKISHIIKTLLELKDEKNITVLYDYNPKTKDIIISFLDNKKNVIDKKEFKYLLKLENLRFEQNKGRQAHRAVHESGHAVCSIILEHSFPETVHSVIIGNKFGGFTLNNNNNDNYYLRKNNYLNRIATYLGGYVAESLIFGDEEVTNGSSSDIVGATEELSSLFKECGFLNNKIGRYISKGFTSTMFESANFSVFDNSDEINEKIEQDIKSSIDLAEKTLRNHWTLFLKLSEYLSKNPKINNKKIKEITKKYINQNDVDFKTISEDKEKIYLDKLTENLNNLQK